VPEACCLAAAAEHWTLHIAWGLRVNPERMRDNLDRLAGLVLSERVMLRLGATLGRNAAHDVVYETAMAAWERAKEAFATCCSPIRGSPRRSRPPSWTACSILRPTRGWRERSWTACSATRGASAASRASE
jgi:hypothetical protein